MMECLAGIGKFKKQAGNAMFLAVDQLALFSLSEFCDHSNTFVPITADQVPTTMAVEYELEPAPKIAEEEVEEKPDNSEVDVKAKAAGKGCRNKVIIYMVDVSGSMSSTTEVPALQGVCVCVCVCH